MAEWRESFGDLIPAREEASAAETVAAQRGCPRSDEGGVGRPDAPPSPQTETSADSRPA